MHTPYVNLVLSGGGHRCLAFVGFLRAARPLVSSVRNVYCVSGGAISGLAFVLGVDDDSAVRIVSRHLGGGVRANLRLLITRFGLDDVVERLSPMLCELVAESFSAKALMKGEATPPPLATTSGALSMTFADLAKATGKNLVVHAVSMKSRGVVTMSVDSTPGERVVTAVCASCAVPLFFCPVPAGGDLLVDGCLAESYPFCAIARAAEPPHDKGAGMVAKDTLVLSADFDAGGGAPRQEGGGSLPGTLLEFGIRVIGILASRWDSKGAAHALGPRARVVSVNAACEVTAAGVMCDGLDSAGVSRLYRVGLDEGHRFRREHAEDQV